MQEDRRRRRAELAHELPRRREHISVMKLVRDRRPPSPMKERLTTLIEQWAEELHKMEAEYHELNVELIREVKRGPSDP